MSEETESTSEETESTSEETTTSPPTSPQVEGDSSFTVDPNNVQRLSIDAEDVIKWLADTHTGNSSGDIKYVYPSNDYVKSAYSLLETRRRNALMELRLATSRSEEMEIYNRHRALIRGVGQEYGPIITFQDGTVLSGTGSYTPTPFVQVVPNPGVSLTWTFTFRNPTAVAATAGKICIIPSRNHSVSGGRWGHSYTWNDTSKVGTLVLTHSQSSGNVLYRNPIDVTVRNLIGPSKLVVNILKEPVADGS